MDCPACGAPTVTADVPEVVRLHGPHEASRLAICTSCLSLTPTSEPGPGHHSFLRISEALPADETGAVGVVVLVNMLDSLVMNRAAIKALVDELEASGMDVFLMLDRLASDPSIDPQIDLDRRRTQLEQFLD